MRAPGKIDQRDAMLAQLVEAFMSDDMPRFRDAAAWLRGYVEDCKHERGLKLIGKRWFDPERFARWQSQQNQLNNSIRRQPRRKRCD